METPIDKQLVNEKKILTSLKSLHYDSLIPMSQFPTKASIYFATVFFLDKHI